jgi:type I restriction enzyme S subunit
MLIPCERVHGPFFAYVLKSHTYIQALQTTTNLVRDGQALRYANFTQVDLPLVPIEEQVVIASFLDWETTKIDELVAEQRRLIELLKEKRQAVISHAVTKGLNPRAPMKPSGIEWLGDVPEYWEVRRLKFLCDVQTGDRDTENAVEDGRYPFFVRSQTVERINSMAFDCEAVLTAGDGVGVGKVFHYHNGPFDFHQRVYMMNNFRGVSGPFLFHFLRENFYKVALEGGAKSTVDSLRRPVFMNFAVCVPPAKEQVEIVTTVEREAEQFDALTAEAQRAIDLLQERRTALISAAVTGQIDVRSHNGKQSA